MYGVRRFQHSSQSHKDDALLKIVCQLLLTHYWRFDCRMDSLPRVRGGSIGRAYVQYSMNLESKTDFVSIRKKCLKCFFQNVLAVSYSSKIETRNIVLQQSVHQLVFLFANTADPQSGGTYALRDTCEHHMQVFTQRDSIRKCHATNNAHAHDVMHTDAPHAYTRTYPPTRTRHAWHITLVPVPVPVPFTQNGRSSRRNLRTHSVSTQHRRLCMCDTVMFALRVYVYDVYVYVNIIIIIQQRKCDKPCDKK